MKTKIFAALIFALTLQTAVTGEVVAAEAWASGMPAGCKALLKQIKGNPGWKAFALSNVYYVNGGPLQSCGWSMKSADRATANANAMKSCRSFMKKAKAPASARCVIKFVSK